MKKKLLIAFLSVICGGIVLGSVSTSFNQEPNSVTEVKANNGPLYAQTYYNNFIDALENNYAVNYKIHYDEIVEALNPYLDSLLEITKMASYPIEDINKIVNDAQAKLDTFKSDADEIAYFINQLNELISFYTSPFSLISNMDDVYTPKYNKFLEILGAEAVQDLTTIIDYINFGVEKIFYVDHLKTRCEPYAAEEDLCEMSIILNEIEIEFRKHDENSITNINNLISQADTLMADASEAVDKFDEITDKINEYYETNERIDYIFRLEGYDLLRSECLNKYINLLKEQTTIVGMEDVFIDFKVELDEIEFQADKANETVASLADFALIFTTYEKFVIDYNHFNQSINENNFLKELIGDSSLNVLKYAKIIIDAHDMFQTQYNLLKDQLPEGFQLYIANKVNQIYESMSYRHSLYNSEYCYDIAKEFNSILTSKFIYKYIYDVAFNEIFNDDYQEFDYEYRTSFNRISNNIYDTIIANEFLTAVDNIDIYLSMFYAINELYEAPFECQEYVQNELLKNVEYSEEYKAKLSYFWELYSKLTPEQKELAEGPYGDVIKIEELWIKVTQFADYVENFPCELTEEEKEYFKNFINGLLSELVPIRWDSAYCNRVIELEKIGFDSTCNKIIELATAKQDAKDNILEKINSNSLLKNYEGIDELVNEWFETIDSIDHITNMPFAVDDINKQIDSLYFEEYKKAAKEEIQQYYDSLDKSNWSDKNISSQETKLDRYLKQVDGCYTKESVDKIVKKALSDLGNVQIEEPPTDGCNSTTVIIIVIIGVVILLAIVLPVSLISKNPKKKESKK